MHAVNKMNLATTSQTQLQANMGTTIAPLASKLRTYIWMHACAYNIRRIEII